MLTLPSGTRINKIHQLAENAFAYHEVKVLLDNDMYRSWRCARPNEGCYSFTVTTIPGHLFIVGDIGDLIVSRTADMINWSRSAVHSIEYFAEKVPQCIKTEEYDSEMVQFWCNDFLSDEGRSEKAKEQVRLFLEHTCLDNKNDVYENLSDYHIIYDSDYPNFYNWNSNFLWCREALIWLLQRLPK